MEYGFIGLVLFGAYVLFRIASFVFSTVIKLAFLAGFIAIGVLAMSSTVGLF